MTTALSNEQINVLQPVVSYQDENGEWMQKRFMRNRSKTDDFLKEYRNFDVSALHFDFARDYFVSSIPMDKIAGSTIHLEDEMGNRFGEIHSLKPEEVFDLHSNFGHNWMEFKADNRPLPKDPFDHLITMRINTIEIPEQLKYNIPDNKLNIKYDYRSTVIFENQEDLYEVIEVNSQIPKIDFSKKLVIYQEFAGDCHMRVELFKVTDMEKKTITMTAYDYNGGCRASGRVDMLYMIDRPTAGFELQFRKVNTDDYDYLVRERY